MSHIRTLRHVCPKCGEVSYGNWPELHECEEAERVFLRMVDLIDKAKKRLRLRCDLYEMALREGRQPWPEWRAMEETEETLEALRAKKIRAELRMERAKTWRMSAIGAVSV